MNKVVFVLILVGAMVLGCLAGVVIDYVFTTQSERALRENVEQVEKNMVNVNKLLSEAEVTRSEAGKLLAEAEAKVEKAEAEAEVPEPLTDVVPTETGKAVEEVTSESVISGAGEFPEGFFFTPVVSTDSFNPESAWLISEPGRFLDAAATFDRGSSVAEHYIQCPEGGSAYISAGEGEINVVGYSIMLEEGEGVNNLILIRCRIDDGLQDTDLNESILFSGYVPGNVMTSPMPIGAYISMHWFRQQLETSCGLNPQSGGNCGASGCTKTYIHLLDLNTGFYQLFLMEKPNVDIWNQIK